MSPKKQQRPLTSLLFESFFYGVRGRCNVLAVAHLTRAFHFISGKQTILNYVHYRISYIACPADGSRVKLSRDSLSQPTHSLSPADYFLFIWDLLTGCEANDGVNKNTDRVPGLGESRWCVLKNKKKEYSRRSRSTFASEGKGTVHIQVHEILELQLISSSCPIYSLLTYV